MIMATVRHQSDVLRVLVDAGSALHFAAERGDVTTARSLLKAGANALIKDKVCVSHNYWPSHLPSFNPPHSSSSTQ